MTKRPTTAAAITFALLTSLPFSDARAYELEDILAAPFDSDLVASTQTDRIAWLSAHEGRRSVLVADAPEFEPVTLAGTDADDGQALAHLAISPDGRWLAFVEGGFPNRSGESPNPASAPGGASFTLVLVDTHTSERRELGPGYGPTFAPDGRSLVYFAGGPPMVLTLDPEPGDDPRPLFRARGSVGQLAWSPDDRKVAFRSSRGRHSFVGVFDPDRESIIWMAPGFDRDANPAWSPDGKYVAFTRLPGIPSHERPESTRGYPFSIWVADAESGEGREIWASPGADGGGAQSIGLPLAWLDSDRLLFQSEHEGYLRTYRIATGGGTPAALFDGDCELADSQVELRGLEVWVSTNCEDRDRHHIWKLNADDEAARKRLSGGENIEVDPVVLPSGRFLAYRASTATRPMSIAIVDLDIGRTRFVSPQPAESLAYADDLVRPRPITIEAPDGLGIPAQLFVPESASADRPAPAVIFYHGGPNRQMLTGWHPVHFYSNTYAFNQFLASRGYVVLALNFRASTGYGRDFRLAANQGPDGASEHQDAVAAARYLAAMPEVDGASIGAWGGSYGGVMTGMSLARNSDLFAAGVAIHGVYDWAFRERYFPSYSAYREPSVEHLAAAREASAVASIENWTSPVLLIHGDDDRTVMFAQSIDLAWRLRRQGVELETLALPDEVHDFLLHRTYLKIFGTAFDFFERRLR